MLKALRMLCAWTPTLKQAVPLLTSTETLTIFCCSIALPPSLVCQRNLHALLKRAGEGATSPIRAMFRARTKMARSGHTGQAEGSEERTVPIRRVDADGANVTR